MVILGETEGPCDVDGTNVLLGTADGAADIEGVNVMLGSTEGIDVTPWGANDSEA